jgi:hypothetical protein
MFNQNPIRLSHMLVLLELRENFYLMRNNEKLLVFERLDGDKKKMNDPISITKVVRIGAPTCDVNAHLNYVTATGIDV